MIENVWVCESARELRDFWRYDLMGGNMVDNLVRHFPFLRYAGLRPMRPDDSKTDLHAIVGVQEKQVDVVAYPFHNVVPYGEVFEFPNRSFQELMTQYLLRNLSLQKEEKIHLIRPVGGLVVIVNPQTAKGQPVPELYGAMIGAYAAQNGLDVRIRFAKELKFTPAVAVDPKLSDYDDGTIFCPF